MALNELWTIQEIYVTFGPTRIIHQHVFGYRKFAPVGN